MSLKGAFQLKIVSLILIVEDLLRGIYAYGYESPSAVQSRAITQICKGRGIYILRSKLTSRRDCAGYFGFIGHTDNQHNLGLVRRRPFQSRSCKLLIPLNAKLKLSSSPQQENLQRKFNLSSSPLENTSMYLRPQNPF
jgi:hypothetical protein